MLLFHADWKDPHTSRPGHQTTKSKCAHVCVCVFVILVLCVQVYYAKFPPQIDRRQILLLHPVLGRCVPKPLTKLTNTLTHYISPESGATAKEALTILKEHGVREERIHVISLFATPRGVHTLLREYPRITILTSEVHRCSPSHFGVTYFGSD